MKLNPFFTISKEESVAKAKAQLESVDIKYSEEGHKNVLTFIVPTPSGMDEATGLYAMGMSLHVDDPREWGITGLFVMDKGDHVETWEPEDKEHIDTGKFKRFLYEIDQNLTYGHLQWTGQNLGFRDVIPINEGLIEYLVKVVTELCAVFALLTKWETLNVDDPDGINKLWNVTKQMGLLAAIKHRMEDKDANPLSGIDARPDTGEPEEDSNKGDKNDN